MTTTAPLPHAINTNTNTDHPDSPALSDEAEGYAKYTPQINTQLSGSSGSEALQAPRSLEREFERLHLADVNVNSSYESVPPTTDYKKGTTHTHNKTTPSSVLDLDLERYSGENDDATIVEEDRSDFEIPNFEIHIRLQGALTQPCVNRVAAYTLIHSMNCESSSMSTNDISQVSAMNSKELVDEERWLLSVIHGSAAEVRTTPSPTTFLEAIGERIKSKQRDCSTTSTTPNPLNVVSNSRTQLWKPSRSWWEAKSGKNPWIEPRLHAKRWRYLWPLIHYHKFLAKCIKKLKRYGVDYSDRSALPCFLRAEVVAISNHLASISDFTAEDWTATLSNFYSWSYPEAPQTHAALQRFLRSMALRRVHSHDATLHPSDEHSPLLMEQLQCDPGSIRTHRVVTAPSSSSSRSNNNGRGFSNKANGVRQPSPRFLNRNRNSYSNNNNNLPRHHYSSNTPPNGAAAAPHPGYYNPGYPLAYYNGYDAVNNHSYDGRNINNNNNNNNPADCSFNAMDSSYDEFSFHGNGQHQWAHLDPMRSIATPPRGHQHHPASNYYAPPNDTANIAASPVHGHSQLHPRSNIGMMSPASQFMMGNHVPVPMNPHMYGNMMIPANLAYPPPPNYDYGYAVAGGATNDNDNAVKEVDDDAAAVKEADGGVVQTAVAVDGS